MKKHFYLLVLLVGLGLHSFAQNCSPTQAKPAPVNMGIVIYSDDPETVWNALRFANFSVNAGDSVHVFLLGRGVVLDTLVKHHSDIKEQSDAFLKSGGIILGCGTCLASRNNLEPQVCKFSSMGDLYDLVRKSKILLTF